MYRAYGALLGQIRVAYLQLEDVQLDPGKQCCPECLWFCLSERVG